MVADKGKKMKVAEKNEDENNQLDEQLVLSIEKLQEIQDDLEKINEEASDKVLEIEQKYNELRRPVYEKRREIIKSIPDFWITAFLSHPALGNLLTEGDQKMFKFLSSLEVEDFKDVKSGYSITFHFQSNPYFEDTKLTKTFTFLDEGTTEITATEIKWKEGSGLPNGTGNDKKGKKRHFSEESFFEWFSNTNEKDEDVQDEIAEIIKEDLWPNPLAYFNTEPDEEGFEEDDDGDKEDDSEEDDDDEDDDDNDEDDDDEDEGN